MLLVWMDCYSWERARQQCVATGASTGQLVMLEEVTWLEDSCTCAHFWVVLRPFVPSELYFFVIASSVHITDGLRLFRRNVRRGRKFATPTIFCFYRLVATHFTGNCCLALSIRSDTPVYVECPMTLVVGLPDRHPTPRPRAPWRHLVPTSVALTSDRCQSRIALCFIRMALCIPRCEYDVALI